MANPIVEILAGFGHEFPYANIHELNLDWIFSLLKKLQEESDRYIPIVNDLLKFIEDIKNGKFPDSVVNAFKDWMNKNLINLVGDLVTGVYFGLTDDGFFVAYIPESWDDIRFNTTNYDYMIPEYDFGHLMLSY